MSAQRRPNEQEVERAVRTLERYTGPRNQMIASWEVDDTLAPALRVVLAALTKPADEGQGT